METSKRKKITWTNIRSLVVMSYSFRIWPLISLFSSVCRCSCLCWKTGCPMVQSQIYKSNLCICNVGILSTDNLFILFSIYFFSGFHIWVEPECSKRLTDLVLHNRNTQDSYFYSTSWSCRLCQPIRGNVLGRPNIYLTRQMACYREPSGEPLMRTVFSQKEKCTFYFYFAFPNQSACFVCNNIILPVIKYPLWKKSRIKISPENGKEYKTNSYLLIYIILPNLEKITWRSSRDWGVWPASNQLSMSHIVVLLDRKINKMSLLV